MRRLLLLPIGLVPVAFLIHMSYTVSRAEPAPSTTDAPLPCGSYQVDGGLAFGLAAVSVTSDGVGLAGRQVFAVFTDESGEVIGEPTLLLTDTAGSASLSAPDSAVGVEFVTEAPPADCEGEPEVISVTRATPGADLGIPVPTDPVAPPTTSRGVVPATPVESTVIDAAPGPSIADIGGFGPDFGLEFGYPPDSVPATELNDVSLEVSGEPELARTGAGTPILVGLGLLTLIGGWWLRVWRRSGVA